MLETIRLLITVGAALCALMLILLAMPNSRLRDVLMPVVSGCFALFCGAYVLSPVDVLPEIVLGPFGLVDDAGAALAGIAAALNALGGRKS